MLLKINDLYAGEHELRILTADVEIETVDVYKMRKRQLRYLRFLLPILMGWDFYKGLSRVRGEYEYDMILFGNAMFGLVTKVLLKKIIVGGFINDYNSAGLSFFDILKTEGGKGLYLFKYVECVAANKLDLIITCSKFLEKILANNYRLNPKKNHCLYQAIDVSKINFKPSEFSPTERIKILFVKLRYKIGGLEDLAKAIAYLNEFRFDLTIIGPEEKHKFKINTLFKNIPHLKISFLGTCAQHKVYYEMERHHILCIPSRKEGLGLANVEGICHGLQIVSTNAGGIPEVLDGGKNGWLCEPANPPSLAKALRGCILSSRGERLTKAINGRHFMEKLFDCPVMLKSLLKLLKSYQRTYGK